jgi:hypothetical protein
MHKGIFITRLVAIDDLVYYVSNSAEMKVNGRATHKSPNNRGEG